MVSEICCPSRPFPWRRVERRQIPTFAPLEEASHQMIVDSAQNSFCDLTRIVFSLKVFCPETDEAASPARRSGF